MRKVVACLGLLVGFLVFRLALAQDVQSENDSAWTNQVDNAIENYESSQNQDNNDTNETMVPGNSDMADMPVNTDNNYYNSANDGG